jgi:hypothetical protein
MGFDRAIDETGIEIARQEAELKDATSAVLQI